MDNNVNKSGGNLIFVSFDFVNFVVVKSDDRSVKLSFCLYTVLFVLCSIRQSEEHNYTIYYDAHLVAVFYYTKLVVSLLRCYVNCFWLSWLSFWYNWSKAACLCVCVC